MVYTQQEINNFYSKYSCCFASLATDYTNSLAIGAFDCGQKLDRLLQFKSYLDILYCYKVDTCIIDQPEVQAGISTWTFGVGDISPYTWEIYLNINDVVTLIGAGPETAEIVIDINANTETTGVSAELAEDGFYMTVYSPPGCFVKADLIRSATTPESVPQTLITFVAGKCAQEETCVEYTEEELNCITNENLDTLLFWMKQQCLNIKNKPTITEVECVEGSENEFSISINDSITIEAGDSIEVSRNGNVYTITNPLPDLEVTIEAGSNITVTGTYPNFTISSTGGGGGGSYTAENGLTESPANTFKLGGTLIEDTTIYNDTFDFTVSRSDSGDSILGLNTSSGRGVVGSSVNSHGVVGLSTNGKGISGVSTNGVGVDASSGTSRAGQFGISPASNNSVGENIILYRNVASNAAGATGIGQSLIFASAASDANMYYTNTLVSKWTDATLATRTSQFIITTVNNAVSQDSLTINGDGKVIFNKYGINTFTGTPAYSLGVDASGNVIETTVSGGSQTLADTLVLGNTSGANDIQFDATQGLLFANTSRLREGTIDAGLGGTKGVAQICAVGYELKWEAGRLYVMDGNGLLIRQSLYNFTTTPTATDDNTLGYAVGSLWTLDDGTVYICSDATATAAVWAIGGIPTLQQVTDAGATTTVGLTVDNGTDSVIIQPNQIKISNGTGYGTIAAANLTDTPNFELPDKAAGTYTFAMLSDVADINTNAVDRMTVKLAESITKGQAVYISGANGTNILVSKADNTTEATSSKTLGLLETSGATNAIVNVVTSGLLDGLNTSAATVGDAVWLGTTGNLLFGLANKPYAPAHLVYIGVVSRVSATVGEIIVKVQNGFELKEIHDVFAQSPAAKDGLFFDATTSLWKARPLVTADISNFVENLSLQDGGSSVAATTYTLELYAAYAYTINQLKIISASGTCTVAVKINGVDVTGISAVAVSNIIATGTATATNTVAVGDKITLVTTLNSALTNLQASLKTTRI